MTLIDEKGRLFGYINIIDLAIILVIVAVVAGSLAKFKLFERHLANEQPVTIKLVLRDTNLETAQALQVGDPLIEATENIPFGMITDKKIQPAEKEAPTADGQLVLATSPHRYDVFLTVKGNFKVTDHKIYVGRKDVVINRQLNMKSDQVVFNPYVIKVEYQ